MSPPVETPCAPPPQRPSSKFGFPHVLAIIPFLVFLALASRGIDFGYHWDEAHNKINALDYSLEHDFTLLPDGYTYPGVNYWLTLGTLSPEILQTLVDVGPDAAAFKAKLMPVIHGEPFLLRLRRVYAFVTALTVIWIFLAVLEWGGLWLEALGSALCFATSWEVVYHARWVAPDTILMQFGALTLLLLIVAWKRESRLALRLAAVAAGLACGTKYPGALLLLPVLLLPFLQRRPAGGWGRVCLRDVGLCLLFLGTYLVTTPGTVLQPIAFYHSLNYSWNVYAGGWYGYTVTPGGAHWGKMLVYFATAGLSAFRPLALVGFGFAIIGLWPVIRENTRGAFLVLLFPVVYALYFSRQATMIVRNYLILYPFIVFCAGRGVVWAQQHLPVPRARITLAVLIAGLLTLNLMDQLNATASVAHRGDTDRFERELAKYVQRRSDRMLLVSDRVKVDLQRQHVWPAPNLRLLGDGLDQPFDEYLSYYTETVMPEHMQWPTNQPRSFVAVIGPREVNLDYYVGWQANDHIVSLSAARVRELRALGLILR
jgi:hypothetical protein